jgi:uncharacterized membrane protein
MRLFARAKPDAPAPGFPVRQLAFMGRHTLVIYLAHLPALYGIAWLTSAALGAWAK